MIVKKLLKDYLNNCSFNFNIYTIKFVLNNFQILSIYNSVNHFSIHIVYDNMFSYTTTIKFFKFFFKIKTDFIRILYIFGEYMFNNYLLY